MINLILKNIIRIISEYKFSLFYLIYFEVLFFLKGYKGFKINFSNKDTVADNIPCPYFFLFKINKKIKELSFLNFIDLGCGSGRVIEFFTKNFPNMHLIGLESHKSQYEFSSKIFENNSKVKIIQSDFTTTNLLQYNTDCFFIGAPFNKESDFIKFMKNLTTLSFNKKIFLIIVNYNKKIIGEFKNIKFIESYYINNNKGYSICCLDNN